MKLVRALVVAGLLLVSAVFQSSLVYGAFDGYLSAADVERIIGQRGITIKQEATGLRFSRKDGTEILRVRFEEPSVFKTITKDKSNYRPLLPPIGMESVSGVPRMPYMIAFLRKKYTVTVTSTVQGPRTLVSFPHLQNIARLIDSRITDK
ncbi:MAG: hypothetical protein EHM61_13850 [Acidobacteria bacterium]|nr:MAG: hypothetical protein EHM61_13850 [Acidobacteriota bacterium]